VNAYQCATCTHYEPPDPDDFRFRAEWTHRYGSCGLGVSVAGKPSRPGSFAVAIDAEEYYATLCVLPTFGCVQHQERTQ
jgi:hypothetical protein